MVRSRYQSWRTRPRRTRVADVTLVGVIALVALAVVVNVPSTIRDTKRGRLDLKVAKRYFKAHPGLGTFGTPLTHTADKLDVACAFRRHTTQGVCMQIDSRTNATDGIVRTWNCLESPKMLAEPLPGPGARFCPLRHATAT